MHANNCSNVKVALLFCRISVGGGRDGGRGGGGGGGGGEEKERKKEDMQKGIHQILKN